MLQILADCMIHPFKINMFRFPTKLSGVPPSKKSWKPFSKFIKMSDFRGKIRDSKIFVQFLSTNCLVFMNLSPLVNLSILERILFEQNTGMTLRLSY